jgi:hypothetical protein
MGFSGMALEARAGHQAEYRADRSPNLEIGMVKTASRLADSKNIQEL